MEASDTSKHAKALSAIGAQKGGEVRARNLTPEARRKIARQAAEARWGEDIPRAMYSGTLEIAGHVIDCAVLENGTRLLTQQTLLNALGYSPKRRRKTSKTRSTLFHGFPPFLAADNLQPFLTDEIRA